MNLRTDIQNIKAALLLIMVAMEKYYMRLKRRFQSVLCFLIIGLKRLFCVSIPVTVIRRVSGHFQKKQGRIHGQSVVAAGGQGQ